MNNFTFSNNNWNNQPISEKLTDLALGEQLLLTSNKGYVIAPQKVLRCFRLSDLESKLLLELMSLMGERNYAFPGHKYLTFQLGKKSTTSIKKALKTLQEKGFIYWEKRGGDLGTNHYWVENLHYNPYIIMSETTSYCVNKILEVYRGEIGYDALYGAVQDFIEPNKKEKGTETDLYSAYLKHLAENPEDRDSPNIYITYCDRLSDHIEKKTGFPIDILWDLHFLQLFEDRILIDKDNDLGKNVVSKFFISPEILDRSNLIEEKFGYPLIDEVTGKDDAGGKTETQESEQNRIFEEVDRYIDSFGDSLTDDQRCFVRGKYITHLISLEMAEVPSTK